MAQLAVDLCGEQPSALLPDTDAAVLTPRLLRLARRPGQSADAYVGKLSDLLARTRSAAKPKSVVSATVRDQPTLERMHGMAAAVAWGQDLARDLRAVAAGELDWSAVDRGCLLSGPPGVGKTVFVRALATSCRVPLITASYAQWHASGRAHQGDLMKAMTASFTEARKAAPAILFIDEIDSFPNRATITHAWKDWEVQVVNALLAEIDGADQSPGIIVIGACNDPDGLDPALRRAGRLDRHIPIGLPDRGELALILREHVGTENIPGQVLAEVARSMLGLTGADCERLVRDARRRARAGGRPMTMDDLIAEARGNQERTRDELWLAAVHEAGHAAAASRFLPGQLQSVALTPRGERVGATVLAGGVRHLRKDDIYVRLVISLVGRAAEEVLLGEATSGSGGDGRSDLALATRLATRSASAFGFDDDGAGLMWGGDPQVAEVPALLAADPALGRRVRDALDRAHTEAVAFITSYRVPVLALADALVEKRALDGDEASNVLVAAGFPG